MENEEQGINWRFLLAFGIGCAISGSIWWFVIATVIKIWRIWHG